MIAAVVHRILRNTPELTHHSALAHQGNHAPHCRGTGRAARPGFRVDGPLYLL